MVANNKKGEYKSMKFKTRKINCIEEVEGERLKRFKEKYGVDAFIYKGTTTVYKNAKPVVIKFWYVVEYRTGIAITGDKTKEAALKRFEEWIQQDKENVKRLNDIIDRKIKECGVINNDELEA